MHSRIRLLPCLLLWSACASAQEPVLLTELIAELQARGIQIIYSESLVPAAREITASEVTLEALEQALSELGLALQDQGAFYAIVRAPPAREPEPAQALVEAPVLETVIVTGSLHRFPYAGPSSSARSFTIDEIGVRPTLASDPLRVGTQLPGVSSLGVSAKPRIRGGLDDELLIMQDGVELLEPFHMADFHSVYSSIDYHTIESLDIYTGGFPSRYGNRMSGVMDIQSRMRHDDYRVDLGLSTFADFINLRGTVPAVGGASYRLSYREGDLSELADFIERRSGIPEYRDVSGRVSMDLSAHWRLDVGASGARDDIAFEDEEETAASRVTTDYLWASVGYHPHARLSGSLTASWLDFSRINRLRSTEEEEKGGFLDHRQDVRRFALRNDWLALHGRARWEYGWQLDYSRADYRHRSDIDRGVLADIIGIPRIETRAIDTRPEGWAGGAYLQWELPAGSRLIMQPSIRADFQDYYGDRSTSYQLSPRLGIAWTWTDTLQLRGSVGRFQQPEGIHELQALDGVDRFFAPQHSDQLVLALDWQSMRVSGTAEIYYKRYGDQKTRFENVFNPFVLLPAMESDRVRLEPAAADATGLDLSLSLLLTPTLTASAHYSYMDARDRIEGRRVDRRWSQQHTVYAGLAWRRAALSLSAAFTWHSGWRTTLLPAFIPEGEVVPVASVLNNTLLRDYLSLDVSARHVWDFPRARLEVYADISNLTDRRNEAGIDFDPEEVEGGYALIPDQETLLGRVVSLGATLSF